MTAKYRIPLEIRNQARSGDRAAIGELAQVLLEDKNRHVNIARTAIELLGLFEGDQFAYQIINWCLRTGVKQAAKDTARRVLAQAGRVEFFAFLYAVEVSHDRLVVLCEK